jgi:hypothetical protein
MTPPAELADEQVFGRFIFGIEENQPANYPPLGTSPLYRQNLNALVNDTLLDFIRGHLNQLTDKLGEKLSGLRRTELEDWHAAVEKMAQEAKLSWVVVSRFDRDDERLGANHAVQFINNIELSECRDKWQKTGSGFALYRTGKADVPCSPFAVWSGAGFHLTVGIFPRPLLCYRRLLAEAAERPQAS